MSKKNRGKINGNKGKKGNHKRKKIKKRKGRNKCWSNHSDVGNLNVYPWNLKYSPRRQFSTHLGQLHTLRQILSL